VELEFIFADHLLDIDRRELRRGGERVALEPQVFDLLVYLLRNRERVVSKDDLLEAIWGGRIVSESTMTSRINAARKAVGDSGQAQRLIRTVPRKGIRFVGAVRERQTLTALVDTPSEIATEPSRPAAALSRKPSIAVLPFANLGGDAEQKYFAEGVVDEIITALSRIPWLFVMARNSSFTYKGQAVDVKQVDRELGCTTCSKARCATRLGAYASLPSLSMQLTAHIFGRNASTVHWKLFSSCKTKSPSASPRR
jgi:DNA-binding winged helix-turn-helix (wHTH) protein